jgi:hypothetical protein
LKQKHENQIVKANKLLGVKYSAWDAIVDDKDKINLLDCNPGPYIWWIGSYFTRMVMSELAKYLVAYANSGSIEDANSAISPQIPDITKIYKIEKEHLPLMQDILYSWKEAMRLRY